MLFSFISLASGPLITDINNPGDNILLQLNGTTFSTYDHGTHQNVAIEHKQGGWFGDEINILLFPGGHPLAPTNMYFNKNGVSIYKQWFQLYR